MYQLYTLVADPDWAEIITLLVLGGATLAWLSFIWGNAKMENRRLGTFECVFITLLGLNTFFCMALILGKFIVPANVSDLLETLRIDGILRYLTVKLQTLLLSLLRRFI